MIRTHPIRKLLRGLHPLSTSGAIATLMIAWALTPAPAASQTAESLVVSEVLQEVRLLDGSVLFGRVVGVTPDSLTFETTAGLRVQIPRAQISMARAARGRVVGGSFWGEDVNRTRLFFAPSARPLPQGEGYVAGYMLFLPFVGVGITDRITLAGGTPVFPGIMGEVIYLAPKVTVVDRPSVDLALGSLAFFFVQSADEGSIGILYGVGTFGEPDKALTVGAGWAFAMGDGEAEVADEPVFVLAGENRVSRRVKLLSENWFAIEGEAFGVFTGGVRLLGDRISADLGLGALVNDGDATCCLPILNFVFNFGRGR